MIKNDTSIIPKLSLFIASIGIATLVYLFTQDSGQTSKKTNKQSDINVLAKELNTAWTSGESQILKISNLKCKNIKLKGALYHSDFRNCNPVLFKCLTDKYRKLTLSNKIFVKKSESYDRRGNPILTYKRGSQKIKLKFFNTCKDTYLPQKKYSQGPRGIENLWDNKNDFVYIDKNYRTNLDVNQWNKKEAYPLYAPSINLSLEKKISYCQSQGMQLLQARFFDAASFYPETNSDFFYKHRFPWTKKSRLEVKKPSESDCGNMYTKECESIRTYQYGEPIGLTWIGIKNSLGNYPEFLVNKFDSSLNLKVSSFYKKFSSPAHRVGYRENIKKNPNLKVAFRCMLVY